MAWLQPAGTASRKVGPGGINEWQPAHSSFYPAMLTACPASPSTHVRDVAHNSTAMAIGELAIESCSHPVHITLPHRTSTHSVLSVWPDLSKYLWIKRNLIHCNPIIPTSP